MGLWEVTTDVELSAGPLVKGTTECAKGYTKATEIKTQSDLCASCLLCVLGGKRSHQKWRKCFPLEPTKHFERDSSYTSQKDWRQDDAEILCLLLHYVQDKGSVSQRSPPGQSQLARNLVPCLYGKHGHYHCQEWILVYAGMKPGKAPAHTSHHS